MGHSGLVIKCSINKYIWLGSAMFRSGKKHGKSPAQVVLRWDLQHEVITIPKSVHASRFIENAAIFDFQLDDDGMRRIDALDEGVRCGPDPYDFDF